MEHPDRHKDSGVCKQEQTESFWPLGSTATTNLKNGKELFQVQHMPKGPLGEIVRYSI